MTANKFNKGDAVRWNKSKIKFKVIALEKDCVRINDYNNTNDYVSQLVDPRDLEPWSNKLYCLYCGEEIDFVPHGIPIGMPVMNRTYDTSSHDNNCPLNYERLEFGYNNKQEALDAYSMRWEG